MNGSSEHALKALIGFLIGIVIVACLLAFAALKRVSHTAHRVEVATCFQLLNIEAAGDREILVAHNEHAGGLALDYARVGDVRRLRPLLTSEPPSAVPHLRSAAQLNKYAAGLRSTVHCAPRKRPKGSFDGGSS